MPSSPACHRAIQPSNRPWPISTISIWMRTACSCMGPQTHNSSSTEARTSPHHSSTCSASSCTRCWWRTPPGSGQPQWDPAPSQSSRSAQPQLCCSRVNRHAHASHRPQIDSNQHCCLRQLSWLLVTTPMHAAWHNMSAQPSFRSAVHHPHARQSPCAGPMHASLMCPAGHHGPAEGGSRPEQPCGGGDAGADD